MSLLSEFYIVMYQALHSKISELYFVSAPATGIGLFRLLFGLVTFQEICFLFYFNHLIFDPIPFMDVEFPMIPFFLFLWGMVACSLVAGYRCQQAIVVNYIFWVVFVNFTPMQRDFDGGFDLFMIGANLLMMFMPIDKAFAIDNLNKKLETPLKHYSLYSKQQVSMLAYTLPVYICLGFLYFDSAIHKMFAEHWKNGLGAWLPATMPYYVSAIDVSGLLNIEILQKIIGYLILVFQFTFIFFYHYRLLKPIYLIVGAGLHLGIALVLNIYPFGLGMLIFYSLVLPVSWYEKLGDYMSSRTARLTVFYDDQCPLCCRTILTINHFDILNRIDFKSAQSYASDYDALNSIDSMTLLKDLYAVDKNNALYSGVDTYAQILIKMGYPALLGYLMKMPVIYGLACGIYRKIADSRVRLSCGDQCESPVVVVNKLSLYDQIFLQDSSKGSKKNIRRITKILIVLFIFQVNSSIHYGLIYRLDLDLQSTSLGRLFLGVSNTVIHYSTAFIGITPHALYLHDHFEGYDHLLAITYQDGEGNEKWLPFVNQQGRMESPNWGRVHSMWANIAVTPDIDNQRLSKFIMKVTAFWGAKIGLDLDETVFNLKLKKISAPSYWVYDLRKDNLSGSWDAIGTAKWDHKSIDIVLPKDINLL